MATPDDDTTTQTAPPPAATPPAGVSPDMLSQAMQLAQQFLPAPVQVDQTPVKRSFLSLLGEAVGGGKQIPMSPAAEQAAGLRALGDFGTSLMAASHYQPGQTVFSNLGQGFEGAQRGMLNSEQMAASMLGAQQGYQQQQLQNRLEALKAALPYLRMQQGANTPNLLLGGGGAPGGIAATGAPIAGSTYEGAIGGHEGLTADPRSPTTVGGFRPDTWQGFVTANPTLFAGMTPEQILGARSDPKLNAAGISWLAQQNADQLTKAGVTPSGTSLGIAHYLGATPAAKVMGAPDNAPVSGFVSDAAVKANPELATMTVGQLKARYANVPNPGFLTPPDAPKTAKPTPAATTATATPPGVQIGGPPPAPPGGATGPYTGGGIGATLNQPPSGKPPGVVGALMQGVNVAQATPIIPGTGLTAGPPTIGKPATLARATPQSTTAPITIGNYNDTPAPATTTPPAQPVPQQPTQADQPPAPPGKLTFEQFQAQHPIPIDPATYTVPSPDLTAAKAAQAEAARQLSLARAGISGDPNKSLSDYNTATQAVNKLQQDAQAKSLELQQAAQKNALDTQRQLYNDEMTRQQQAELKAQELAQQAAENEKQRQAQVELEHIKAGTLETAAQKKADIDIAQSDLTERAADAQKAGHIIPVLQQIGSQLGNLPGGVVGTLLAKYDTTGDLTGMLSKMGIVDPSKATAAQLLIAARNFLSIETKPAATGSLRVPEMDKLQAYTPGMLNTPQAQQEMISRLIAYQQRIQDERDFAGNYFGRTDPKTGQRIYDNRGLDKAMNAPVQYDQNGVVTGGGLGPVVPEPPSLNAPDAEHQAYLNYVRRNVKPGMPYQTYAPQTDANGNIVRDANGRAMPQRVTKVKGYD